MKVGLIGAGRRMTNIYVPLLKKLNGANGVELDIVGFTTRTTSTAEKFSHVTGLRHCRTRDELVDQKPDFLLICVNSHATPQVLRTTLRYKLPILIETPVEDALILGVVRDSGVAVGVMEQWPYLPLEQFKNVVYESGLMTRPFLVENDCRSYDYHAIAQLRTYLGRAKVPMAVTAARVYSKLKNFANSDGVVCSADDSWEIGTVSFMDGSALHHKFSYPCKTAPFRSLQSLRAYSCDGTILTGKMIDRSNDYEIIDVEYLSGPSMTATKRLDVSVKRDSNGALIEIASDIGSVVWHNVFAGLHLDDNEVAMAAHFSRMHDVVQGKADVLYTINDAVIDQQIVSAIKLACMNGGAMRMV